MRVRRLFGTSILICYLNEADRNGYLNKILDEIILQSRVEFNYEDEDDD